MPILSSTPSQPDICPLAPQRLREFTDFSQASGIAVADLALLGKSRIRTRFHVAGDGCVTFRQAIQFN